MFVASIINGMAVFQSNSCVLAPHSPLSLSVSLSSSLVMESSSNVPKRGGGSAGSRKKTKEGSRKVIKEEAANPLESMQGGDSVAMEQKVLEVASGSDVIAAVYDFAKRYQVDVTIISAYGMVSNITIFQLQPFPTFPVRRFNRLYDLVSIKGSFCGGTTCSIKLPLPPPRALSAPQPLFPAQNEDMPTETFGLDEMFSGTGRSMTAFGVPSVASPANLNVWKSPASDPQRLIGVLSKTLRLIRVLRDEVDIAKSALGQVNVMIAEMEAIDDLFEYADSLGCLKDSKRILGWKIMGLNQRIEDTEGEIRTFEGHLDIMDAAINSE
ncbi:AT-hook motif nuclear-localized protein 17 [Tanacetum coccineum]